MDDSDDLEDLLRTLQLEHRRLDERIGRMVAEGPYDELLVKRLKLRKLALKDQIACIENRILPDIIA